MGRKIDLDDEQVVELHGNAMVLTITIEEGNEIHARIESEEGGQAIGVKQHPEDGQTMVFYLKNPGPRFRIV
ncbi:MAG: hypothetical protein ACRCVN_03200 [Spirochaetia bacterium]